MSHTAPIPMSSSGSVPWPLTAGAIAISSIIFGLYWDISWHTTIGRDTFWTPAHLAIQFGAVLTAVCCGFLILSTTFGSNSAARDVAVKVWGFRGPFGAFLAAWGGATMLISAPFDNWWHDSFGLDVQIVSPPHMVLATGIFFVGVGTLVMMAGPKNRAEGAVQVSMERLFIYIAGLLLTLYMILLSEFTDPVDMHGGTFYRVLCYGTPLLLMAFSRGTTLKWGATKAALLYFVLMLAGLWIFPLFPGEPKLGPVYTRVTHMVPLAFPLMIFVPAAAIDWLTSRMADGNKWLLSLAAGISFLLVCMAVQWPFADFMVSSHARNAVFGMNYFPYMQPPSSYHFAWEFKTEPLPVFWKNLGIAAAASFASAGVGLVCGDWLRRLRR